MPHNEASRRLTEHMAFFFVDEARKSMHHYPNYDEEVKDYIEHSAHLFKGYSFLGVYIDYYFWNTFLGERDENELINLGSH